MATFVATTASNGARLKDIEGARNVLDRYYWDGDVQAAIEADDDHAYFSVYGYDWPNTWKIPDGVRKDNYEPDDDGNSGDGVEDFLLAIAPFLAEPLTIQSIGAEKCRFPLAACEWHVRPGATEVELNGFRHNCSEPAPGNSPTEDQLPEPDLTGCSDD